MQSKTHFNISQYTKSCMCVFNYIHINLCVLHSGETVKVTDFGGTCCLSSILKKAATICNATTRHDTRRLYNECRSPQMSKLFFILHCIFHLHSFLYHTREWSKDAPVPIASHNGGVYGKCR